MIARLRLTTGHICLVVVLAMHFLAPSAVFARLGEDEKELEKRFGPPFFEDRPAAKGDPAEKILHYRKNGITVIVTIWRGRSAAEGYKFADRIEGDSLQTAEAIFDVNANGRDWKKHPDPGSANPDILHYWETGDAKVFAAIWRSEPAILEVSDQAFMQERNRGLKAAGSGAGGF